MSRDHLAALESDSIYILREAFNRFSSLAMLWSIGKDSTVLLWLVRKAFLGHVPFPVVHIDTTFKIPSMIDYRDAVAREWKLRLIVCGPRHQGRMLLRTQEGRLAAGCRAGRVHRHHRRRPP